MPTPRSTTPPAKRPPGKASRAASKPEQAGGVEPLLLSLEQAGQQTGLGATYLRSLTILPVSKGGIRAMKIGTRILIPTTELVAWIERELRRQNPGR